MCSEEEVYEANRRIAAYNRAEFEFEEELDDLLLFVARGKKKRKSPHMMYRQRRMEGAHNVLIDRHLLDDETKFREYFRLSSHLFQTVLQSIKTDIEGTATTWNNKPIPPEQKLCITLR